MPVVVSGTDISPAPSSLGSLQRCVLDYIQGSDDSHLLGIATRAINMAIDKVNAAQWKRLFSTNDITLVADTATYDLPSNFKEALHAQLLNSDSEPVARIYFRPYKSMSEDEPDISNSGEPCYYSIDHNNRYLALERPSSAAYISKYPTLRLWYHTRLARLVDSGDAHGGPPEFDRFLCWDARADVAAIRGESSSSDRAMRAAEQMWRLLRIDDKALVRDWPDV